MSDETRLKEAVDALREALRVEPSPALLARVRSDAAAGRPQRAVVWLGAAAALLVGAAAASLIARPKPPVFREAPQTSRQTAAGPASSGPEPAREIEELPTARPSATARLIVSRASEAARPLVRPSIEVIVAPGQIEALAHLVERINAGATLPPRALLEPREASATLAEPASIEVKSLDPAPINPSSPSALSPIGRGDS